MDKGAPRTHAVFEFEFLLNERSDHDWIFNREPRISLPLRDCAELSLWGLPTAVPEAVLFYKAGGDLPSEEIRELRPHDELDFRALLPKLTDKQRSWLQEAISLVHPAHPWLTELGR